MVLAVAALSPAAALGAAKGTDRPLKGTRTATSIVNLATGTGTVDGTFRFTHLGKGIFYEEVTSTLTGNTFVVTGTETFVAANGDKLFVTVAGTGTLTSTGTESTIVGTITGGTGRFADASGTFTATGVGVIVSVVGSIVTSTATHTPEGQISY
ncbi:MAG: hypothetical protein AABM43_07840 [Actinomycetota bacterium]